MSSDHPLLSLCMPTNGISELVFQVLESIYSQNINNDLFEVIVMDNGNNADFKNKIEEYNRFHANLHYFQTDKKLFMNEPESYKKATGDFIKFVNHRTVFMDGALQYLIDFISVNLEDKPFIYFLNGSDGKNGIRKFKSFNEFVKNLGIFGTWSTGMGFWKSDFDQLPSGQVFNELFPHTTMLFSQRHKSTYILDDSCLMREIPVGHGKKGKYDLYYAFAVEYPYILTGLLRDGDITYSSFMHLKDDILSFCAKQYIEFNIDHKPHSYDVSNYKKCISVFFDNTQLMNKVKEILSMSDFLFPFEKVNKGDNIVLYGGGGVGGAYYAQCKVSGYCKVVHWLDKNADALNADEVIFEKPDILKTAKDYDRIVIAIENTDTILKIRSNLINDYGVNSDMIVWRDSEHITLNRNVTYSTLYYCGKYDSWKQAMDESKKYGDAYQDNIILKKVAEATQAVRNGNGLFEQDGIVFNKQIINYQLISAFLYAYSHIDSLNVLDFGGALGSTYFRYRHLWDEYNASWTVIEQDNYVKYGEANVPEVQFIADISDYKSKADVLLLSSVLGYLSDPYKMFGKLLDENIPYVIIDETAFDPDNNGYVTLQHVPETIYKAVYPCTLFSLDYFKKFIEDHGYEIINEWDYQFGNIQIREGIEVKDTVEKGFLLKNVLYDGGFIEEYVDSLKQLYHKDGPTNEEFLKDLKSLDGFRNKLLLYIEKIANREEDGYEVADLFERLFNKLYNIKTFEGDVMGFYPSSLDVFRLLIWQSFICTTEYLIKGNRFKTLYDILRHTYFLNDTPLADKKGSYNYTRFFWSKMLENNIKNSMIEAYGNYSSLAAYMLYNETEFKPGYSKEDFAEADLFLYQVYDYIGLGKLDDGNEWIPLCYPYTEKGSSIWNKLESRLFCEKIKILFGCTTIDELKEILSKENDSKGVRYPNGTVIYPRRILSVIDLKSIATLP